jgi:hypothetical protein
VVELVDPMTCAETSGWLRGQLQARASGEPCREIIVSFTVV